MPSYFRHYKNKDYKMLGIAKHSESLEELAVYECLYDNPQGKLWVRPKELFEGTLNMEGRAVRRFAPLSLTIQSFSQMAAEEKRLVVDLATAIFPQFSSDKLETRLEAKKNILLLVAFFENQPVGFKLGYESSPEIFYSWLGGVIPLWRGRGVAAELMNQQHDWCRAQGYSKVSTKTKGGRSEMLMLNLRFKFQITGTEQKAGEDFKVCLEKSLSDRE